MSTTPQSVIEAGAGSGGAGETAFDDAELSGGELVAPSLDENDAFTEDELAELALAADPDRPIDADAVPLSLYLGQLTTLLPQWYMPPAIVNRTTRWRTALVIAIVVALVMIDAWGLCSTYGAVVPA
jgi:hypothetical protein